MQFVVVRLLACAILVALAAMLPLSSAIAAPKAQTTSAQSTKPMKQAKVRSVKSKRQVASIQKRKVAAKARPKASTRVARAKAGKRTTKTAKARTGKRVTRIAKTQRSRSQRVAGKAKSPRVVAATRSGNGRSARIVWNATSACLPASVRNALYAVSARFGTITVNSTIRSPSHNRRVGGAPKSMHLQCRAADFRVHGNNSGVLGFLRSLPGIGGVKRYLSGFYHIDNGPVRTWKG